MFDPKNEATFLRPLTPFLARRSQTFLTIYCAVVGFVTYFSMYGFRTPFKAATYTGIKFAGTDKDFKSAAALAQILGYAISKFVGVKVNKF